MTTVSDVLMQLGKIPTDFAVEVDKLSAIQRDYGRLYRALTYLVRETPGGKHYHDIIVRGVEYFRRSRTLERETTHVPYLTCLRTNPFK
jgi:hypothetical protein